MLKETEEKNIFRRKHTQHFRMLLNRVMCSYTKYIRALFNNGRARDFFLGLYILVFFYFFGSFLCCFTLHIWTESAYVHSKLRLYILFSIEIHHSLTHTHGQYTCTNTGRVRPRARQHVQPTPIDTCTRTAYSVRVLPQRKSSITSLAHSRESVRIHSSICCRCWLCAVCCCCCT